MSGERSMADVLRNTLQYGDLRFRDFVELALYHPEFGYYARASSPVGKGGDFITAPSLSPVFSFALSRLVREFLSRCEGAVCSIVDIGCGDGALIRDLAAENGAERARFFGVDRALSRASEGGTTTLIMSSIDELPRDGCHLILSNELYDAFPFARLVQRGDHVHELWVTERDGALDWTEHEAAPEYEDYFADRGIELAEGQFADVSLEWEAFHADVLRVVTRGLVVTIDYGFPAQRLFDARIRRFGTAAAYAAQRVSRDLLVNAGEQDLTAHINFTDLERAGAREGATTLYFERLARFLLSLGITEHELFRPVLDHEIADSAEGLRLLDARDEARRLVLPDGIGEDMRVLVQAKGIETSGWSFQRRLF